MSVHPIEYRYFYPDMKRIWEEESKLRFWLNVEAALARAHASVGSIPKEAAEEIGRKATLEHVKLARVKEIEKEIDHDLMALVKALTEQCEGGAGNYVHLGATSYDIEDTALALQFRDAMEIIEKDLTRLKKTLLGLASMHKQTVCIGRTHGQHALPTTYGLKFAVWAAEVQRNIERLAETKKRVLVGKMTGAVGTQAAFGAGGAEIQQRVMKELGIEPVMVSTQVVQRDRHAELVANLVLAASLCDKIAREIRNLQRSEIAEVFEPFRTKQVGSSTMPHKRNPHKSERVCGLFRVIKSFALPAIENNSLEHERDLTNSAAERIIFPETFILTDYVMRQTEEVLAGLEFNMQNIERNLGASKGLIMTEHLMLGLVKKGVGRQEAHEFLRRCSQEAYKAGKPLREVLVENGILEKFSENELDYYLDPKNYIGTAVQQVEMVLEALED